MSNKPDCLFCAIVRGEIPAHVIWSSDKHMAFLSIFPNTKGFSVVIPKDHYSSYAFAQSDQVLGELMIATKKVARILDHHFKDVARCGMFFEGFAVDHLHTKLFPMHGTGDLKTWRENENPDYKQFFKTYPGYLSSNDSLRADDKDLAELAHQIRQSSQEVI